MRCNEIEKGNINGDMKCGAYMDNTAGQRIARMLLSPIKLVDGLEGPVGFLNYTSERGREEMKF